MKEKTIKFGKLRIKLLERPHTVRVHLDFGRYKKGRDIDTRTIYDAIYEKHKVAGDVVWLDIQDKKAIGMMINVTMSRSKR